MSQLYPMKDHQETLPWFKLSVAGLLLRRPQFDPRTSHVRSALGQVLGVILFLPFKFIPTIPVDARSKASVCGRSLMGLRVRIPPGERHGCVSLVRVKLCQVEVSASGWSPDQSRSTECSVFGCDLVTSTMTKTWPTRAVARWKKTYSTNAA
jgi:hypothetical protein